ncbi:MAG: hypothetical protein RLN78_10045 [Phycisphaerales bacterium]
MIHGPFKQDVPTKAISAGYRDGDRGTHTSRTMMLSELREMLELTNPKSTKDAYFSAIVDDNILGKQTLATRQLTSQRLSELYGLSPDIPLFRALRVVWEHDPEGLPLSALLVALARDPLLRLSAQCILNLEYGSELVRTQLLAVLRSGVGDRLSDATLDKVARNVSSSWTQSTHLIGRVRKVRQRVEPSHGPVALAMWMGHCEGLGGASLLSSSWCRILDHHGEGLIPMVLRAKQQGLLHAAIGGGVVEINAQKLDAAFYDVEANS